MDRNLNPPFSICWKSFVSLWEQECIDWFSFKFGLGVALTAQLSTVLFWCSLLTHRVAMRTMSRPQWNTMDPPVMA